MHFRTFTARGRASCVERQKSSGNSMFLMTTDPYEDSCITLCFSVPISLRANKCCASAYLTVASSEPDQLSSLKHSSTQAINTSILASLRRLIELLFTIVDAFTFSLHNMYMSAPLYWRRSES